MQFYRLSFLLAFIAFVFAHQNDHKEFSQDVHNCITEIRSAHHQVLLVDEAVKAFDSTFANAMGIKGRQLILDNSIRGATIQCSKIERQLSSSEAKKVISTFGTFIPGIESTLDTVLLKKADVHKNHLVVDVVRKDLKELHQSTMPLMATIERFMPKDCFVDAQGLTTKIRYIFTEAFDSFGM
ncbi:hypothetical protein BY458DRAFT_555270 [Sporodiniella umbellata]|nr:hypothetical protein BY458DRAFT_555270 [Sporodiniella umbellata]